MQNFWVAKDPIKKKKTNRLGKTIYKQTDG